MSRPKSGEDLVSKFLAGPGKSPQGKGLGKVRRIKSQASLTNGFSPLRCSGAIRSPHSSPKMGSNENSIDTSFSGSPGSDVEAGISQNNAMKKRLVEQFYKIDGKVKQRLSDITGASSLFGGPLLDLKRFSGQTDRDMLQTRDSQKRTNDTVASGVKIVDIQPFDDGVLNTRECADMLLDMESSDGGFELENLTYALKTATGSMERTSRLSDPLQSGTSQLLQVEQHLRDLQVSVDEIITELSNDLVSAKTKYHDQTQRSMEKVTQLAELLRSLTTRVDSAKARMARNRDLLEREMAGKIATLEIISGRFKEYDMKVAKQRGQQLVASLCLLMVIIGIYMALNGASYRSIFR